MTTKIMCLLALLVPLASAKSDCTLKVEKAVLRYYENEPGVVSVETIFHFRTESRNIFHSECLIYSETVPNTPDRYPIFKVNGPVQVTAKNWGSPTWEQFDFQSKPVAVVGQQFQFSNTLDFPERTAQRRGELEMTIEYQWVDAKGISDLQKLRMIVPYNLDAAKSKRGQGKALTPKEIVLMPVNAVLGVIKLVTNCGGRGDC